MNIKPTIVALCGSTRKASSNHLLIDEFAALNKDSMTIIKFGELDQLPHFNPDLDNADAPAKVHSFRSILKAADGVLICTPEYAVGVPGTLKNAIDWTVSSMDFSRKPVALITASVSGKAAHQSLLGTLLIIEARMTEATQLLIPFVKSKLSSDGKLVDANTLKQVLQLSQSLLELTKQPDDEVLSSRVLISEGVR